MSDRRLAVPGLYAWWADERAADQLSDGLQMEVEPGLIYAGQAGGWSAQRQSCATLASRVFGNHMNGRIRQSTFRMTLAAVLRPVLNLENAAAGSLEPAAEQTLSMWIASSLSVSTVSYPDRRSLLAVEGQVLSALDPPLNIGGMGASTLRARLKELRKPFRDPRKTHGMSRGPEPPLASGSCIGPTPADLAGELRVPAKALRSFLRAHHPRASAERGATWGSLPPEVVADVRAWAARRRAR